MFFSFISLCRMGMASITEKITLKPTIDSQRLFSSPSFPMGKIQNCPG